MSARPPGWRAPARFLGPLVGRLRPISLDELDELDERAALLRRVDVKYVVDRERLTGLLGELSGDHDVLEIDGVRAFAYDTVYVDTPDLRCFREHAAGIVPRFKARARSYVDTGTSVFEVKVKPQAGETDKHQTPHTVPLEQLSPAADRLLESVLHDAGIPAPHLLRPSLRTRFRRVTLASRHDSARLTLDLGVTLARLDGAAVRMQPDLALIETKSEDGDSRADRALCAHRVAPISLSKYRTGIDALCERDTTGEVDAVRSLFG